MDYKHLVGYDINTPDGFAMNRNYAPILTTYRAQGNAELRVVEANLNRPSYREPNGTYQRPYISALVEVNGFGDVDLIDRRVDYLELDKPHTYVFEYELSNEDLMLAMELGLFDDPTFDEDLSDSFRGESIVEPMIFKLGFAETLNVSKDGLIPHVIMNDIEVPERSTVVGRSAGRYSGMSALLHETYARFIDADKDIDLDEEAKLDGLSRSKRALYIERIRNKEFDQNPEDLEVTHPDYDEGVEVQVDGLDVDEVLSVENLADGIEESEEKEVIKEVNEATLEEELANILEAPEEEVLTVDVGALKLPGDEPAENILEERVERADVPPRKTLDDRLMEAMAYVADKEEEKERIQDVQEEVAHDVATEVITNKAISDLEKEFENAFNWMDDAKPEVVEDVKDEPSEVKQVEPTINTKEIVDTIGTGDKLKEPDIPSIVNDLKELGLDEQAEQAKKEVEVQVKKAKPKKKPKVEAGLEF